MHSVAKRTRGRGGLLVAGLATKANCDGRAKRVANGNKPILRRNTHLAPTARPFSTLALSGPSSCFALSVLLVTRATPDRGSTSLRSMRSIDDPPWFITAHRLLRHRVLYDVVCAMYDARANIQASMMCPSGSGKPRLANRSTISSLPVFVRLALARVQPLI